MNDHQIRIFGCILGEYVRALGMDAENKQRETLGQSMAYVEQDFAYVSAEIQRLAREL